MNYTINQTKFLVSATMALCAFTYQSSAVVLDFNGQSHGAIVSGTNNPFTGQGVSSIVVSSPTGTATIYDTGIDNGLDSDLEGPSADLLSGSWEGGNLQQGGVINPSSRSYVGKVMIIQEGNDGFGPSSTELTNGQMGNSSNGVARANDDGNPSQGGGNAGTITFTFSTALSAIQFDWIDLDETSGYSIQFFDDVNNTSFTLDFVELSFRRNGTIPNEPDIDEYNPAWFSPGEAPVDWGDPTSDEDGNDWANRFPVLSIAKINSITEGDTLSQIDRVTFTFGGSGGFANVDITPVTPVPEPRAFSIVAGLFVLTMTVGRRRHSK